MVGELQGAILLEAVPEIPNTHVLPVALSHGNDSSPIWAELHCLCLTFLSVCGLDEPKSRLARHQRTCRGIPETQRVVCSPVWGGKFTDSEDQPAIGTK